MAHKMRVKGYADAAAAGGVAGGKTKKKGETPEEMKARYDRNTAAQNNKKKAISLESAGPY